MEFTTTQEVAAAMIAQSPHQPPELTFLGSRARVLADGAATHGRLGLVDMLEVPAGQMPPLHVHRAEDEGFYVLEGEVTLFEPGAQVTLRPGDFFLARRGIPHTYRVGHSPARWLVTSTPAGFERFVAAVAALDVPDPARLAAVASEHAIELLGPPGTLPDAGPAPNARNDHGFSARPR